jgi:sarcosine oxidase subunit gamma
VADPGSLAPRASVPGLAERRGVTKVNLRADRDGVQAVARALGVPLPRIPNTSTAGENVSSLWLGPDEWLVVSDVEPPPALLERLRGALAGHHAAVTDVSDARTIIRVTTPGDLLAKGCGLDLHPRAFGPGACAQTLLARIPVILHRPGHEADIDVYVPRSFAEHLRTWLTDAALEFLA